MITVKIVLGISGATGAIYGVRLLEELQLRGAEVHLVVSRWGEETIRLETGREITELEKLTAQKYDISNMGAAISSGSFPIDGTIIAPCSMKTLSAIAHGFSDNLIVRAADVALKEKRPLILMPRETPLTIIHLQNMLEVARAGATVMPPMPAYYNLPESLDDIVNHWVGRVLDHLGLKHDLVKRWGQ